MIELPDISLSLVDRRGRQVAETKTALDGRFAMDAPASGDYRLCYQLGSGRECGGAIRAEKRTGWSGDFQIAPPPMIHGIVLTRDGRPCWVSDSFFNLDVSTQVLALTSGSSSVAPKAVVRANVEGEYAILGLPDGQYDVVAVCEGIQDGQRQVALQGGPVRVDLTFANRAPEIESMSAYEGNAGRTFAKVGRSLEVRAKVSDLDSDTIQYIWRVQPHAGQLTPVSDGNARWDLPGEPGLRSAYLIARDGKGGYAYSRVDMKVGTTNVIDFSGQITNEVTRRPVADAVVEVGGVIARTDANGWFSVQANATDSERYVLNVRHRDYAFESRILDRSARGMSLDVTPAQVTSLGAGEAIKIVDRTSAGFCGRTGGEETRPLVRRAARTVFGALAERRTLQRPVSSESLLALVKDQDSECVRQSAEIALPAGALADSRGRPAAGPVRASVATLNPSRRALPGDYRAVTAAGRDASLLSFGAVYAQFSDASGRPLNLRPGATAEVRIPVPPSQMPAVRPTMPLWSYDERRGLWVEEGEAKLERNGSTAAYVGRVRHFSVINVDNPGAAVADVTCVRFKLSQAFGAWSNIRLRAYVGFSGASTQVGETTVLDANEYHVVFTIPYKFPPTAPPNTLRLELKGTISGVEQVLLDNVINTDLLPKMTGSALFPPYPYDECATLPPLDPAAGIVPPYLIDATNRPIFLTGPGGSPGSFNPAVPETGLYYDAIDPGHLKATLGGWWAQNGFGAAGQNGVRASYMNNNDLGLGRDMHCLAIGSTNLACYVTNYGLPDQSAANAGDAASQNPVTRGATVAMEFDQGAGVEAVQFYVFGGGTASAPRINFADLDGFGPKPVPYLCTVCHGGKGIDAATHKVANARFREFDAPTFRYTAGNLPWNFNQTSPPAAVALELQHLGSLNQMVRDVHPGTLIGDLIDRWYPGNNFGNLPGDPGPNATWAGPSNIYRDVYGQSCRTCHIARQSLTFDKYGDFSTLFVKRAVCGNPNNLPRRRVMPNAAVTYRNFWANSQRVSDFDSMIIDNPPGPCGG